MVGVKVRPFLSALDSGAALPENTFEWLLWPLGESLDLHHFLQMLSTFLVCFLCLTSSFLAANIITSVCRLAVAASFR